MATIKFFKITIIEKIPVIVGVTNETPKNNTDTFEKNEDNDRL